MEPVTVQTFHSLWAGIIIQENFEFYKILVNTDLVVLLAIQKSLRYIQN